jgi:3-hydroxyacyl-[acyl-carrier-protein] dehydratase
MKLLDDLCNLESLAKAENKLSAAVRFNPSHEIFAGHFPGNPVLPGVCIIQIIKELLEMDSGTDLIMTEAASIKYISFIVPDKAGIVNFDIVQTYSEEWIISCNCNVSNAENVFCKLKCVFRKADYSTFTTFYSTPSGL